MNVSMFKLSFLFLFIFYINVTCNKINKETIQEDEVLIENFPYVVSIRFNDNHVCGGTILNNNTVLTSAQCILDLKSKQKFVSIRAGSSEHKNGQQIKVIDLKHPTQYKREYHENDVAIIKLAKYFKWSTKIQPISLPDENYSVPDDKDTIFVGWGVTESGGIDVSDTLHKSNVRTISYFNCSKQYGMNMIHPKLMLCTQAKEKEFCRGDLGGPLVLEGKVVGVASWIYDCDKSKYPGVYSNIIPHLQWIKSFL